MHSVTDGQTDDVMMPLADHTVYQYDRLKIDRNFSFPVMQLLELRERYCLMLSCAGVDKTAKNASKLRTVWWWHRFSDSATTLMCMSACWDKLDRQYRLAVTYVLPLTDMQATSIQYNTIQYEVFRAPNSQTQQRDGDADYYSVAISIGKNLTIQMSFKPTFKNLVWTAAFNRKRQFIPL